MEITRKIIDIKKDNRGSFFEILRREDIGPHEFGQISISTANPGETKGGHYHKRKREWYYILQGQGEITFLSRDGKEKHVIVLNEFSGEVVEMPINVIHSIKNIGTDTLVILIYITEPFIQSDSDTFTI